MTLVLGNDEKIENQLEINSVYGKGILYVTTNAIVVEINKKGIVFERLHNQIAAIEAPEKKKIKITWPEGRQLFNFTFKTDDAAKHVKEIAELYNYEDNFPDLMGANTLTLSEKDQKDIIAKRAEGANKNIKTYQRLLDEANLKLNIISSSDPQKTEKILDAAEKTKEIHNELTMWQKYLEDIPNIAMNRSKKIPKEIPNHRCWNDCWFDVESDCFITFNETLHDPDFLKDHDLVKKFHEKNTIPNVCAIPFDFVKYENGYPMYISIQDTRIIIPTMNDEMLTDEIISKKFGIDILTVGDGYPVKIAKSIMYNVNPISRLILKNGQRYHLTRNETLFLSSRKKIPKEEMSLLA